MKLFSSRYQYTTDIFLRLLGVVYFLAFYSLWSQFHGLVGEHGILPMGNFFEQAGALLGKGAWLHYPSLFWISSSDMAISFVCAGGMAFSVILVLGLFPLLCTVVLWLFYLSITVGGQVFLAFQWDNLLLESGFLAILLAPAVWRSRPFSNPPVPRIVIFLLQWLLFRLMFASGIVKLASHDDSWWNLTALSYHFWTQPLPVWISWYANQLPLWMLKFATGIMFFIELVVPFFIFTQRYFRYVAFVLIVLLQLMLIGTGNYGFFNLLTIVLCFPLLDDRVFSSKPEIQTVQNSAWVKYSLGAFRWSLASVVLFVSAVLFLSMIFRSVPVPSPVLTVVRAVSPWRSINNYGLFAAMTKSRPEIIIEGSSDGRNWLPYEFQYKPGDVYRTPLFTAPYMPRLDWQMWFAALGTYHNNPWLINFMTRILEGEPEVMALLDTNPFAAEPPKMVRAVLYDYTFATPEQNKKQYLWWNRELKGLYCPVISKNP